MINKDAELKIEKICRSCMSENENMLNVFDQATGISDQSLKLSEMLMACASIEVTANDGMPFHICRLCEGKLNAAFQFKKQCENSDSVLRELTNNKEPKRKEDVMIIKPDLPEFDNEDVVPLAKLETRKKRGRPKKTKANEFTCSYCNKVLHTRKGLRVHERKHTGEKLRYCLICNAHFTRTNHLVRHLNTHDKPGIVHNCSQCEETFTSTIELYYHTKIHSNSLENRDERCEDIKKEDASSDEDENEDSNLNDDENEVDDVGNDGFENSDEDVDEVEYLKIEVDKDKGSDEKQLFKCKECDKVATSEAALDAHMRKHTGDGVITCKLCDKTFTKKNYLTRHLMTHGLFSNQDKKKKVMECEFCDRKFKYRKSYQHHMQAEHGMSDISDSESSRKTPEVETQPDLIKEETQAQNSDQPMETANSNSSSFPMEEDEADSQELDDVTKKNQKSHICHVCGANFARANHLTRHMSLHRAVLVHKCDRCEKAFAAEEFLLKHVEEEHINKPYVCTICNKPFSRGEHLIRHLKLHQNNSDKEENLKCSICDHTFTRSDHLARHTKIHLLQDKRHVCFDCGKAFNRLDNLKTHQRIHTGVKDTTKLHLCIYCGKEFNNSSNMIVHMRRHTGERPYKCNECGKGFPRSHDLKCHERTHSGEKPYLCTLCGKSFNKSNKLLRHSRVHTGERPYVCNICGRAFTQSNDLSLHMRRHTGARPYACGVCPARFIQSGQLKTHRRTTGHWMETQPDLKGGHRVEPVTPASEPTPIRFKSHGIKKKEDIPVVEIIPVAKVEYSPMILDTTKLEVLRNDTLVGLTSVIHSTNGEDPKFKTEIPITFAKADGIDKNEASTSAAIYDNVSVVYPTGTTTTYTSTGNFTFQTYE